MKILFYLGHPAHYHLFKNVISELLKKNHKVSIIIKKKDILEDLLIQSGYEYLNILPEGRKNSKAGIAIGQLKQDFKLLQYAINNKPDIMVGTSVSISHVGKLLGIPSINVNEDDAEAVPLYARLAYPWANHIIAPECCSVGKWEKKKISYNGYQKLAYLHPNRFYPDKKIKEKYIKEQKYFILRLSALNAYHDIGMKGLNEKIIDKLINKMELFGKIYITSEKELPVKYNKYKLNINPLDIHHILAFSSMFIGDSQSMSVESALLGVPSIRYSSFAGKLSVLEELEHKYELTYGFVPEQSEAMFEKIEELLNTQNLIEEWKIRRQHMLQDKIDVTAFMVWFIENYPKSVRVMKENPNYQYNFK